MHSDDQEVGFVTVFALSGHVGDNFVACAPGFGTSLVTFTTLASVTDVAGVVAVLRVDVLPLAFRA